jgi:CRP-like cAMP-binding protein
METRHLKKLASLAREMSFSPGDILDRKGELGKALYLIEEGEVVIETEVIEQGYVPVNRLGPGEFFGWSSLFPPERKMGQTRAVKPTRVIAFSAESIRAAMKADHTLEYGIVRRAGKAMIDRIKAARQQLAEFYTPIPS